MDIDIPRGSKLAFLHLISARTAATVEHTSHHILQLLENMGNSLRQELQDSGVLSLNAGRQGVVYQVVITKEVQLPALNGRIRLTRTEKPHGSLPLREI